MQKLSLFIIGIAFIVSGCASRVTDFTIISTKNIDLSRGASFQRAKVRTTGNNVVHGVFIFDLAAPNMKDAIDKAIQSVPGCIALLDGVVTFQHWFIPFIYGQKIYAIEGTPLIDSTLANNWMDTEYIVVYVDKNGNAKEIKSVSESEYKEIKAKLIPHSS